MKTLDVFEDFLNSKNSRNEDNTKIHLYNCGGYALKTYSWYSPVDTKFYSNIYDMIDELYYEYDDINIAIDKCLELNVQKMLQDFPENLRVVNKKSHLDKHEDLIAYRLAVNMDHHFIDEVDFHYVVKRHHKWTHKCGGLDIEKFHFTERPWDTGAFIYNSPIIFLAFKNLK